MIKNIIKSNSYVIALWALSCAPAHAQAGYPSKPIRLIVPFAPGGSSETLARQLSLKLPEFLGQPVVVDNRAGGNGTLGVELIARAAPDGYTLGIGYIANLAINPALYNKLPYDAGKDFLGITQLTSSPNILATHPALAAQSLKELVALAKAKPGHLNYASGGVGTIGHLSAELLKNVSGTQIQHIVYKGSGQAVIDLLGGHVNMMFSGMSAVLPQSRNGKLRAIATTGLQRSPAAVNVPTVAETYAGFEAIGWFGVIAPAGLPRDIAAKLNRDIVRVVNLPDVKERLNNIGFDIVTSTPEQYTAYIRTELAKWNRIIKAAGITVD